MTKSYKTTFATVAAITAALSFAVVPALTTSQAFAQDCPGCQGKGHEVETTTVCTNPSGKVKGTECPGNSEGSDSQDETTTTTIHRGKSDNIKDRDTSTV